MVMVDKIFVKANDDLRDDCLSKAANWYNNPAQKQFTSTKHSKLEGLLVNVVAEYLANEKGFTLYDGNAKYPKVKANA